MANATEKIKPRLTRLSEPDGGREVLFLHGAWHGAWCWEGLSEAVAAAGHGVTLLDLPGHGADRRKLGCCTSIRLYAKYASRAAASLDRPVLVAHSMGGWIAQKVLEEADLPAVLLAPLPGNGLPWGRLAAFFWYHAAGFFKLFICRPLPIDTTSRVKRFFLGPVPEDMARDHMKKLVAEPAWAALEMGLHLARARPGPGKEPRLIIATEEDFFFPPKPCRKLAKRLGADIEVLKGLPHNMWQVDPGHQVRDLILEFLAKLDSKPGGETGPA